MGFSKSVISEALAEKERQRKAAEGRAAAVKARVYQSHPELTKLDMNISAAGAKVAITALAGGSLAELQREIAALTAEKAELLKQAGCDERNFLPKYSCPLCEDIGFHDSRLCSCVTALCSKMICERMSAEMPLGESTFDRFELSFYPDAPNESGIVPRKRMKSIFDFCRQYAEAFTAHAKSILFLGNTGLGKTHLSLAIANTVIEKGYSVVYGPAAKLFRAVESERFGGGSGDYYDGLLHCDLLIIDDLGTEFVTQFIVSVVNDLVNTRMLENRPVIINTNYSLKDIADKYTPRVTSRIMEKYEIKQFLGADIRQIKSRRK